MKQITRLTAMLLAFSGAVAHAADGLVTLPSAHSVGETTDRLEKGLNAAGFRVFARIDHAAGAKSVGIPLAPTELLIFGKPDAGTLLMQSQRTVGIDLPLKYLVWEDADGKVTVGWNDPAWISARHGIADKAAVVQKMQGALKKFAIEASQP
ncbi:MAG: DUF302 domain-containing protein [Chromatiaceae bacterium]|nr:DUF302 domain-containing protein [Chromatiaceae bacterium]